MIEVERNIQVVDERDRPAREPGRCKFTIRGERATAPAPGRPGPDISTRQSREVQPREIFMGRYF